MKALYLAATLALATAGNGIAWASAPATAPAASAAADAASEWRAPNLIALHLPRNKIGGNNEVRLVAPRLRTT